MHVAIRDGIDPFRECGRQTRLPAIGNVNNGPAPRGKRRPAGFTGTPARLRRRNSPRLFCGKTPT
ncbi:hypothetical protein GCM10027202_13540 [Microvirgula curvata]